MCSGVNNVRTSISLMRKLKPWFLSWSFSEPCSSLGFLCVFNFLSSNLNSTGAVSYRDKKVRNMASPSVRQKINDTENCIWNEPQLAICVVFAICLRHKTLRLIFSALLWKQPAIRILLTMATATWQLTTAWQYWAWLLAILTTHENLWLMCSSKGL